MGCGRSGTTLTDILIGNLDGIESCGEINRFYRNEGNVIGLDKDHPTYKLWHQIGNSLAMSKDEYQEFNKTLRRFEYYTWLPFITSRNKSEYLEKTKSLLVKIFDKFESEIIVDSSKYPARAIHLSAIPDLEVKVLYVIKDPKSVIKSFSKRGLMQPRKSFVSALLYYLGCNFLCQLSFAYLKLRKVDCLKIKYEDLVNNTFLSLKRISSSFDLVFDENDFYEKNTFTVGHLFEGNRIRLSEFLSVRKDQELEMTNFKNIVIRFLTYPFYR